MLDFGGARHWKSELGKLAPQTIVVNGNHYERTEFGGPWMYFNPEERAREERQAREDHERRMFQLNTAKEWYSMTEEQRKSIGSQLFPTIATPEGGWTREKLVESGIFSRDALSKQPELFWSSQSVQLGNIRRIGIDPENQSIYAFQGRAASVSPNIGKFTELAQSENYFGENRELSEFLTQLGREAEAEFAKRSPKAIEAAKSEALKKKIEASQDIPRFSGRDSLKRGLSSPEKNTLRIGGVTDTDEIPVNIPT